MAKKYRTNKIDAMLTFIAVLLGVVSLVMLFVPNILIKDSETSYTGFQIVFGYVHSYKNFMNQTVSTQVLTFSFMNLLTYVLVAVGIVFTVLSYISKGNKLAKLIATLSYLVAGVLFFFIIGFTMPVPVTVDIPGFASASLATQEEIRATYMLGAGAIVSGVCSIIAVLVNAYKLFK